MNDTITLIKTTQGANKNDKVKKDMDATNRF